MLIAERAVTEMPAREASPAATHRRLSSIGPLGIRSDACLHLNRPYLNCVACRDACPQGCLSLDSGTVELSAASCNGCGLCAARCPTGALVADGFSFDDVFAPGSITAGAAAGATAGATFPAAQPLDIACAKNTHSEGKAKRVPCLGGIDSNTLLSLVVRSEGAPIRLLDDGACQTCATACGKGNPVTAHLDLADRLLAAALVPAAQRPALLCFAPLPSGNNPKPASAERRKADEPLAGRRAFFGGLARATSAAIVKKAGHARLDLSKLPKQPRQAIPFMRGHHVRLTMAHLAQANGGTAANAFRLARIEVSAACRTHGTCSRICPTGALQIVAGESENTLTFDPWLCIDCKACATACPEKALRYEAPAWRGVDALDAQAGRQTGGQFSRSELARVAQQECSRCNASFAANEGTLCGPCARSSSLAQSGIGLFSGFRGNPMPTASPAQAAVSP